MTISEFIDYLIENGYHNSTTVQKTQLVTAAIKKYPILIADGAVKDVKAERNDRIFIDVSGNNAVQQVNYSIKIGFDYKYASLASKLNKGQKVTIPIKLDTLGGGALHESTRYNEIGNYKNWSFSGVWIDSKIEKLEQERLEIIEIQKLNAQKQAEKEATKKGITDIVSIIIGVILILALILVIIGIIGALMGYGFLHSINATIGMIVTIVLIVIVISLFAS